MSSNLNKLILVDNQLEDYFLKVQAKEAQNISLFKVVIVENSLKLDYYNEGTIPGDFEQVNNSLQPEEPCFFLLKQSDISWSLISWLPEGHVKVRDRMKYATGRNTLKEVFGHKLITNDYHFTQLNEFKITKAKLNSNNPKKLQEERRAVMTPFEIIREEVKESQKVTQNEQIAALKARAEKAEKTSLNHFISGGFHQVQIPLSQKLKESIENFKNDQISWIELKVTDKKDSIDMEKTFSSNEFDIDNKQTKIPVTDATQPRFFLCKVPNPDYKQILRANTYPLTSASKSSSNSFASKNYADYNEDGSHDTSLEESSTEQINISEDGIQETSEQVEGEKREEHISEDASLDKSFTDQVKVSEKDEIQETPDQIEEEEGEEPLSVKDRIKKLHSSNSFDQPSSPQYSETEPKFYSVLIYYCPSSSPPRLRMVYSTCSGGIIQQFDDLKLEVNFKIDQFDPFSSNASLSEIHDKVNNYQTQANVTKLGKQLNLTKLVSNSHTQSKIDESESQIKIPKFSQLKRTGHPVFGQQLPH